MGIAYLRRGVSKIPRVGAYGAPDATAHSEAVVKVMFPTFSSSSTCGARDHEFEHRGGEGRLGGA